MRWEVKELESGKWGIFLCEKFWRFPDKPVCYAASADELPRTSPRRLLFDFERPEFLNDPQWVLRTDSVQFYLGGSASGAQPHWHAASWNWLVHGSKRWFLWPPSEAIYSQAHVERTVGAQDKDPVRRTKKGKGKRGPVDKALVCDQRPGEVMVLPETWGHATVNLQRSIGWASEFHFDRSMDDGLSDIHGDEWWRTGERPNTQPQAMLEEDTPRASGGPLRVPMGVYGSSGYVRPQ